jgi:hypothetical protein
MSASDGYIGSTAKIVDHGPNSARWNLVFLGDGYQASELNKYHDDVRTIVDHIYATAPFHDLWCGINVHRIDVVSTDSGADDPVDCPDPEGTTPSGAAPRTYYDAAFCSDSTVGRVHRLCAVDSARAKADALARVPDLDATIVVINSAIYGGGGGEVATCTMAPSAVEIAIHETGHSAFELADEYGGSQSPAGEPMEVNVTADTNRATIKWRALIAAATPLPSSCNAGCATCTPPAMPPPAGAVGAYGGARYVDCGYFRPLPDCKMRTLSTPFCPVCEGAIRAVLQPFQPAELFNVTTPSIAFQNVPEGVGGIGVTTYRAIVLEGTICQDLTFEITTGPTGGFGTPLGTSVLVQPDESVAITRGRLWISYTSTTAGATASGTVRVRARRGASTLRTWKININANTVARPKTAITLVLDHSGSMSEEAGDGTVKVQKLREAVNVFIGLMKAGDGLGMVRFDDTAQELMPVTDVGPETIGAGRLTAIGHANGAELDPAGATSIGAGVVTGKGTLDAATSAPPYAVKAMLVLTDGVENTAPMLSAVGSSITANTFAIGLGTPFNISTAALTQLTQTHNGYLLITGTITPDQSARLSKYFIQILAGMTNANIVIDPHNYLPLGGEHRVPFAITEADIGIDAIVLSPLASLFEFVLETPDGSVIGPASSTAGPILLVRENRIAYYRLGLPALQANPFGSHGGGWHLILRLSRRAASSLPGLAKKLREIDPPLAAILAQGIVPYDAIVHTQTTLQFTARIEQSGIHTGDNATISATLTEYDIPVEDRARVWAEVTLPNQASLSLPLEENLAGQFVASLPLSASGLYTLRVRTRGQTLRGTSFEREQTVTAFAYPAGYEPPSGEGDSPPSWCRLFECLFAREVWSERASARLKELGIDPDRLRKCLARHCQPSPGHVLEQSLGRTPAKPRRKARR